VVIHHRKPQILADPIGDVAYHLLNRDGPTLQIGQEFSEPFFVH